MSLKFWSITTTIRNPERIAPSVSLLKEFDGYIYNKDSTEERNEFETNAFIRSVERRWYGVNNPQFINPLPQEYKDLIRSALEEDRDLTYDEAKEIILWKQNVEGVYGEHTGGLSQRGRQFINAAKKFFLCWYDDWSAENKKIFKVHPQAIDLIENVTFLFRHCLLFIYQYPEVNVKNVKYSLKDGYNIRPLVATLSLIKKVNELSLLESLKPNGITMDEFGIFCITMIHGDQIDERAKKILNFRSELKKLPRSKRAEFIKNTFISENSSDLNFENKSEYDDNLLRNFLLTLFFKEKRHGATHYINLDYEYIDEIDKAIEFYGVYATIINDKIEQTKYFTDINNSIIFDKNIVIKEIEALIKKYPKFKVNKLNKLSFNEVVKIKEDILLKIRDMNINQIRKKLLKNKSQSIKNIVNEMKGDYQNFSAEGLEKITSDGFMCLANSVSTIKPNYSIDEDGNPKSHAKAGVPDIECYLENFNLICEVTKLTGREQWYNESVPIARHLNDFENNNPDKDNYCLFIAPRIHNDGMWAIWCCVKHGYLDGNNQKIIPISIEKFANLINYFSDADDFEDRLQEFMDRCLDIKNINDFESWRVHINNTFDEIIK